MPCWWRNMRKIWLMPCSNALYTICSQSVVTGLCIRIHKNHIQTPRHCLAQSWFVSHNKMVFSGICIKISHYFFHKSYRQVIVGGGNLKNGTGSFGVDSLKPDDAYIQCIVSGLATIVSDNGFSPGRRQAITWYNGDFLSTRISSTYFIDIFVEKVISKCLSAKCRPFWLGLNELNYLTHIIFGPPPAMLMRC